MCVLDLNQKAMSLLHKLSDGDREALYENLKKGNECCRGIVPEIYRNDLENTLLSLLEGVGANE